MVKDRKVEATLKQTRVLEEETKLRLKEAGTLFNTESKGYIEVETERERTLKVTQEQLKKELPIQAANNIFNLRLVDFGPYNGLDVTRNGKYILLGGRKGHLAMIEWKTKRLVTEF
jgi:U3 small nucleolar RNA-associated protein 7